MPTYFEWVVEEVDSYGDIQETQAHDTAKEAQDQMTRFALNADMHYEWCLTRNVYSKDGNLTSRLWSYIKNMEFVDKDTGMNFPVPQKYIDELKALKDSQ